MVFIKCLLDLLGNPTGPILFYSEDEPYYEFTNFAYYPIIIDRRYYTTPEHYFQSQKFVGTPYEGHIAMLPKPRDAFDFSCLPEVSRWIRKDWQQVKEDVMYKGLFHKFTQYKQLMELLLGTGDRRLVEDSPHDSYWGIGRDHRGQNRLGELLMRLRDDLRGIRIHGGISTDGDSTTHNPSTQLSPSNTADSCFHSNIAGHDETGEKPDKDGSNVIIIDDDDDGNDHPNPNHTDMKPSGDNHGNLT